MSDKLRSREKNVVKGKGVIRRRSDTLNQESVGGDNRKSIFQKGLDILGSGVKNIADGAEDIAENIREDAEDLIENVKKK